MSARCQHQRLVARRDPVIGPTDQVIALIAHHIEQGRHIAHAAQLAGVHPLDMLAQWVNEGKQDTGHGQCRKLVAAITKAGRTHTEEQLVTLSKFRIIEEL